MYACMVKYNYSYHPLDDVCNDGDVRLVGGYRNIEGRVEICYNGVWGGVCHDHWDRRDAIVVCRQVGLHTTC